MANRLLTINIRNYLVNQPRRKRPTRIYRWVRFRIAQQTNVREDNIKISKELNEIIMKRHIKSMKPLKVNISIDKEIATVTPFVIRAIQKPADAKAQAAPKSAAAKTAAQASTATATSAPAKTAHAAQTTASSAPKKESEKKTADAAKEPKG
jgi:ribosomal protein L31E